MFNSQITKIQEKKGNKMENTRRSETNHLGKRLAEYFSLKRVTVVKQRTGFRIRFPGRNEVTVAR